MSGKFKMERTDLLVMNKTILRSLEDEKYIGMCCRKTGKQEYGMHLLVPVFFLLSVTCVHIILIYFYLHKIYQAGGS